MKKHLMFTLLVLTATMSLYAKPEPRFKEKGISTKYYKDIDALVYSTKWGQYAGKKNPMDIKIIEYGDKAGERSNTSWLSVSLGYSGNGYVGMEYILFSYMGGERERINLEEISPISGFVNFSLGSDTFSESWSRDFRGELADDWAKKFVLLANGNEFSSIKIYGSGAFYRSYYFTKKDKEGLRKLGEAWLKYFSQSN